MPVTVADCPEYRYVNSGVADVSGCCIQLSIISRIKSNVEKANESQWLCNAGLAINNCHPSMMRQILHCVQTDYCGILGHCLTTLP